MRPVLHGDLTCTARVLLATSPDLRQATLEKIVEEAEKAELFLHKTGRPHPNWGTGSLMTSARRFDLAIEPNLDDPDYAKCLIAVLERVAKRRYPMDRKERLAE